MSILSVLGAVEGVTEETLTVVGPVVLQALVLSNPKIAVALPAIQSLAAAVKQLIASGVFTQSQADAAVATAASSMVVAHVAVAPTAAPAAPTA